MPFILYDYVDSNGKNEFKDWTSGLQKPERIKLNAKLDMLFLQGTTLRPETLANSPIAGVDKLRFRVQKKQFRPLLTDGPINKGEEFTLLLGAREIGDKWSPPGAPEAAEKRKQTVIKEPNRRVIHERVS